MPFVDNEVLPKGPRVFGVKHVPLPVEADKFRVEPVHLRRRYDFGRTGPTEGTDDIVTPNANLIAFSYVHSGETDLTIL